MSNELHNRSTEPLGTNFVVKAPGEVEVGNRTGGREHLGTLSIVIVEFHSRPEIDTLLESVRKFEPGAEVIVSSNSLYDVSRKAAFQAAAPGVRFLWNERNLGYAGGVNRGLALVTGDVVAILNPDVELVEAIGDRVREEFIKRPDAGLIGPKVLDGFGAVTSSCRRFFSPVFPIVKHSSLRTLAWGRKLIRHVHMLDVEPETFVWVDWISGGAMFVRRDALESVGGMDERYFLYFEDVDWCREFWRRGWRVGYTPSLAVVHRAKHAATKEGILGALSAAGLSMGISYVRYLFKNGVWTKSPSGDCMGAKTRDRMR